MSSADLYGLLNVDETASTEEIKKSFNFLSKLFHPDKIDFSNEPESIHSANISTNLPRPSINKSIAQDNFQNIVYAYEILSDSQKRLIYDTYGHDGLSKFYGLQTIDNNQSTQQILDLLRKEREMAEQLKLESQLKPSSKAIITVDLSNNFDDYNEFSRFSLPEIHSLSLAQNFSSKISSNLNTNVAYTLKNTFGRGSGSISTSLNYSLSQTKKLQSSFGIGNDRFVNLLYAHIVSSRLFYQIGINGPFKGEAIFPHFQSSVIYAISPTYSMTVTMLCGFQNAAFVSVKRADAENDRYSSELTFRHIFSFESSLEFKSRVLIWSELSWSAKGKVKISSSGHSFQLGIGGIPISSALFGSFSIESGTLFGVIARFGLSRNEEASITIPILLSHDFDPVLTLVGMIFPPLVSLITSYFFVNPIKNLYKSIEIRKLRNNYESNRRELHQKYLKTVVLLERISLKKMERESSRSGLIVKQAHYGPIDEEWNNMNSLEITHHLNALIEHSTSSLHVIAPPQQLLGMYDPAFSKAKCTKVTYSYHNEEYECMFLENQPICLPIVS